MAVVSRLGGARTASSRGSADRASRFALAGRGRGEEPCRAGSVVLLARGPAARLASWRFSRKPPPAARGPPPTLQMASESWSSLWVSESSLACTASSRGWGRAHGVVSSLAVHDRGSVALLLRGDPPRRGRSRARAARVARFGCDQPRLLLRLRAQARPLEHPHRARGDRAAADRGARPLRRSP